MMIPLLLAWALSGAPLDEAARALAAGRTQQAGEMIDAARKAGDRSEKLTRLDADQAMASRQWDKALTLYHGLLLRHPDESLLLERAGIAALHLGRDADATALLDRATAGTGGSWRAWNGRGVAADRRGDFEEADAAYAHAVALAPTQALIANNQGWSLLLRGRWADAIGRFEQALSLDPRVSHGASNLELARAALANDLPSRREGESDGAFAARLNDAGVLAAAQGDKSRAIAAFTRAIDTSARWNAKAAANLAGLAPETTRQ